MLRAATSFYHCESAVLQLCRAATATVDVSEQLGEFARMTIAVAAAAAAASCTVVFEGLSAAAAEAI